MEEQDGYNLTHLLDEGGMEVHTFPRSNIPKMNLIAQLNSTTY